MIWLDNHTHFYERKNYPKINFIKRALFKYATQKCMFIFYHHGHDQKQIVIYLCSRQSH